MSHLWGDLSCHFDCYRRGTQITEFFLYFATSVSNTLIFNIGSTTPLTAEELINSLLEQSERLFLYPDGPRIGAPE